MSMYAIEEHQRQPCVSCGLSLCHDKGYGPEYGLCYNCALRIANLFCLAHSGEPLFRDTTSEPHAPKNTPTPVSQKLRWSILRRDQYRCQVCGETDRPLHVDHIIPRAKGGGNSPSNLQCLCDKCNMRKGAR